jgi:phenylalanyl-tRNA synthetase beta chain
MNISSNVLRRYIEIPSEARELRGLLDDIGVEVKRLHEQGGDMILGVELLANRGDHHCYAGIAREIGGRTGSPLCGPAFTELEVGAGGPPFTIESEFCTRYSLTLLQREGGGELPEDVLLPLSAADIHSLGPAVDATNLSNIEIGQPTHAFDADKVQGRVSIRLSKLGETAWPLFQDEPIKLPEGLLVIADERKILAIAGVIGCEDSKTTPSTTRLLLESAAFDPVAVRTASRALNIHTDSVARFERGSDPTLVLVGAGRVVHLLEKFGGWSRMGTTGMEGSWKDENRHIALSPRSAAAFLEVELGPSEIMSRLQRYGFACLQQSDELSVRVPAHRLWDVETPADLYEELAKSIGYNNTPTSLPLIDQGAKLSQTKIVREKAEEVLLGHGFYEVITDGFYGRGAKERAGFIEGHPLHRHVEILNAMDRGYSQLKNNAFIHAMEAIARNLNRQCSNIKIYEWTRTFHLDPSSHNSVCSERKLLWGAVCGADRDPSWAERGRTADPHFLAGIVEELSVELNLPLRVIPSTEEQPLYTSLHPYRQASITLGSDVVGILGEVHPAVLLSYKIKRVRPCYFEVSESALQAAGASNSYRPPPVHQPLSRTITFALPPFVNAASLAEMMVALGAETCIVDLFGFEDNGQKMRAITYELIFPNPDGQRSADSVNALLQQLIADVHRCYGEQGVVQR